MMVPRDDRHFEYLVAAHPAALDGHDDFDFEAIEVAEQVEELVCSLGALGMTRQLAEEVQPLVSGDRCQRSEEFGVLIRDLLRIIINARNPRLVAEELRIAFGFRDSNGESMRSICKRYGVTPAALSKSVIALQRSLNLPKNSFNKTAAACEVYALTNKPSRAK